MQRKQGGFAGHMELLVLITIYAIYLGLILPIAQAASRRFEAPLILFVFAPLFCCYALSWVVMLSPSIAKKFDGNRFLLGNQILAISVAISLIGVLVTFAIRSIMHLFSYLF